MKMLAIQLSTTYPIYIDYKLLHTSLLIECCIQLNKRLVIITDHQLMDSLGKELLTILQQQKLDVTLLAFPAGEANKTRETKQMLEDALLAKQYGRDTCLIALGGGVVTDLVGFIAATYCRGIPVIYVPTTLLAMVDASIGGKTAVNTPHGKNLIGTFTQPHAVFIDTHALNTLPKNEWCNGMAEIIKHSVIADAHIFSTLQQNITQIKQKNIDFLIEMIHASCLIKKNIVEQDEREQGIRQLLNFGHTIGHAIEAVENYHISHGEAVAIGMLVESYLSVQQGYLQETNLATLKKIFLDYDLPLQTSAFQNKDILKEALILDKKSIAKIPHFVLLDTIGQPHRHQNAYAMPIASSMLDQALDWAAHYFRRRGV